MTDKEIIRAEVERFEKYLRSVCKHSEANDMLSLLSFIDSMQEEPVSEDFEAEWKEYFKYRGDVATVNIKDLARHFANWQKKQIEKEYDDFINKGLVSAKGVAVRMAYEKGKEEMINKACELLYKYNEKQAKHGASSMLPISEFTINVYDFRKEMEDSVKA